jgi:predicted unusual protein kinase regulating ubiquinone biosynthesis (AarF/ABC1/UbiB family)
MTKRIFDLGAMSAQVAAKELEKLTLNLFSSANEKKKRNAEIQEQIAEIIFSKLSHLKGTGLKLLQALSLDEDLLPQPYIKKFEQTYNSITPLSKPVVRKIIKVELNANPEEVFAEFDYHAFAAASLGQVHRAKLTTGEDIIVKVQYPNVADNMETDIAFIQTLAKAIGNPLISNTITELSCNLMAEIDYHKEAENLLLFDGIKKPVGLVTPKVYQQFSTARVLTLSHVSGETLNVATHPEQRNSALEKVFQFFFMSLKTAHCLHADPHPGNILVAQDHTGLIDFGSVKKDIPQDVIELFILLCNSASDKKRIVELYGTLGADTTGATDFYAEHIQAYHELCSSIVGQDLIDFSSMNETVTKMRRILFTQASEERLKGFSSEFTLLHKSFQSLLFLLCKYQAKISTRTP